MAERRSKWDRPAEGGAKGTSSALTVNAEEHKPAARAAAAAAAKIAAQFGRPDPATGALVRHPDFDEEAPDGAFTHDIEINDHRNRYLLTKRQTQLDIFRDTGAKVFTKGTWYPDKTRVRPNDPPLFLHISADTRESLDRTIARISELMARDLPPLLDDRLHRGDRNPGWPEEKVRVPLEPLRNFNVRAKLVGPNGLFVKYIQNETKVRTQIRGVGSGYLEADTGREMNETMFVHLTSPEEAQLKKAKELAQDLVAAVIEEWKKAYVALGYGPPPDVEGEQPPLPPQSDLPPPPPEDEAPPEEEPPREEANGVQAQEDEALQKYWKDYVAWEKSFVDYHGRKPTKDEGGQDVPPEHRA